MQQIASCSTKTRPETWGCAEDDRQRQLFSPFSNFPTRALPPLGSRASYFGDDEDATFKCGQHVCVRRFLITGTWSPWRIGIVTGTFIQRGYVGFSARNYTVLVESPHGPVMEKFTPFVGEIFDPRGPPPTITSAECTRRCKLAIMVYAKVMFADTSKVPRWIPAIVLSSNSLADGVHEFTLRLLAGPDSGRKVIVNNVIPYTLNTMIACMRHGHVVESIAAGDMDLDPPAQDPILWN